MLLIVTALSIEAEPYIRHFGMKRDASCHAFPLFVADGTALLVSGAGKLGAAIGTTYLLTRFAAANDTAVLLNVGFCGSFGDFPAPGEPVFVNRVHDVDTGRDSYPEILPDLKMTMGACGCFSRLVSVGDPSSGNLPDKIIRNLLICDMESAGIMSAAAKFLPADRVIIMKIVSDPLTPVGLDRALLRHYAESSVSPALELVARVLAPGDRNGGTSRHAGVAAPVPQSLADGEDPYADLLLKVAGKLRLTAYMRTRLAKDVRYCLAIGRDPAPALLDAAQIATINKTESKERYADLRERLIR